MLTDLDLITTRKVMWIPNKYASLVVYGEYNPIEVWKRVYGALLRDGVLTEYAPLVDFLCASVINSSTNTTAVSTPTELLDSDLRYPRCDRTLLAHRSEVVAHALAAPIQQSQVPNIGGL